MSRINRDSIKSVVVLVTLAVAAAIGISPLAVPRAFAETGYPNVGVFVPDTLHCGRVETVDGPELQFGGTLPTDEMVIIRLSTDGWWPKLPRDSVGIDVDGTSFGPSYSGDQYQLGGPGWQGDLVSFTIRIRDLPLRQLVRFDARWGSSAEWGHIADGWIDQPDCSFTTNPKR